MNLNKRIELTGFKPTLNMNGDLPAVLKDQQKRIYDAAEQLEKAIRAAAPHGRNYQSPENENYLNDCDQFHHMLTDTKRIKMAALEGFYHIRAQQREEA